LASPEDDGKSVSEDANIKANRSEIGGKLLMEDSQENERPGFGSATNSERKKSRHAFRVAASLLYPRSSISVRGQRPRM